MPTRAARCANPKCSCLNCTCVECHCGAPKLGDLEQRIMAVLWEVPGQRLTGREVADALGEYAYTTVATVLDRLVHKELVRRRMDGGKIHFSAVGSPGAHAAVLMRQAMAEGPDPDAALTSFARTLSPAELATLRVALDRIRLEPADSNR